MSPYLVKILLFLLPLVLAIGAIEAKLQDRPNPLSVKHRLLNPQMDVIDTLVLGTSHMLQVRPNEFSKCGFNFANHAQDLYYDSALLAKFGPELKGLKTLIIELGPFSLDYRMDGRDQAWRQAVYQRTLGIPCEGFKSKKDWFSSQSLLFSYGPHDSLPWLLSQPWPNTFFYLPEANIRADGSMLEGSPTEPNAISEKAGKARFDYYQFLRRTGNREDCIRNLEAMLTWAQSRALHTVLLSTPVHANYRKFEAPELTKDRLETAVRLSTRFGSVVANYEADPRFGDSDFSDVDHLNQGGSLKFSRMLKEDLANPRH